MQFPLAILQTIRPIRRIHNPYKTIRLLKVVSPIGSDGLLATNVPDVEFVGTMFECFDVEA
jgi:hypothetical protein